MLVSLWGLGKQSFLHYSHEQIKTVNTCPFSAAITVMIHYLTMLIDKPIKSTMGVKRDLIRRVSFLDLMGTHVVAAGFLSHYQNGP